MMTKILLYAYCVGVFSSRKMQKRLVEDVAFRDNLVQRVPPIAPSNAKPEGAVFNINWLSASGTAVFLAAVLSGLVLRLSAAQWREAATRTAHRLVIPIMNPTVFLSPRKPGQLIWGTGPAFALPTAKYGRWRDRAIVRM